MSRRTNNNSPAAAANVDGPVFERAAPWPVYWSAVWVGTLTALAVALVLGLAAAALGAHLVGPGQQLTDWRTVNWAGLIFGVAAAFAAFVAGGWVAVSVAGLRRSETAMLHGAIVWLVAVPLLVTLAALGAGSYFGSWYGGLEGRPAWAATLDTRTPAAPTANADEEVRAAAQREAARIARNNALGAVTGLLLGLLGSVIGGWMASGEPMTLTYYRTRPEGAAAGDLVAAR